MFAEWLTQLTTPCKKPFRQMGYLAELIAIKHRHRRCRRAWQPHLKACKTLIAAQAETLKNRSAVVVLGSGQLLDIPIETLSGLFDTVFLVDICHLRNSRTATRLLGNIQFIETDISGTVARLQAWQPGRDLPEPVTETGLLGLLAGADYVVSANLLAQLPLAPLHYLEKNAPDLSTRERDRYAQLIMGHHLALLNTLACPVTLISETRHVVTDGDTLLQDDDPLLGLELPGAEKEWEWDLALRPELGADFDLRLRVAGISDLAAARRQ